MTARSEHGRYVRSLASIIASDKPADTATLRDAVINNTNHLLDQRCNFVAHTDGDFIAYESETATWYRPYGHGDVVFPITILSTGDSAKIVTRVQGYAGSGTAKFRVQLMPFRARPVADVGDSCAEVSTTSGTAVDLEPDPIFVPADEIGDLGPFSPYRSSAFEHPTLAADGSFERIKTLLVRLRVWMSGDAHLTGLSVREYIGG